MAHTTHSAGTSCTGRVPGGRYYADIRQTDQFVTLRRRLRWFVFPMTALFLCWYLAYVLLAAYAHDFMGRRVAGSVNVGLLLGALQFVSTVAITVAYLRFTRTVLDPRVTALRAGWAQADSEAEDAH